MLSVCSALSWLELGSDVYSLLVEHIQALNPNSQVVQGKIAVFLSECTLHRVIYCNSVYFETRDLRV